MLACPTCAKPFADGRCDCRRDWTETGGVPDLFAADADGSAVEAQRAHYEEWPGREYRPDDTLESVLADARADALVAALDDQVPARAAVLEAGCGTGRLANVLAARGRDVLGLDLSMSALLRAEAFRRRAGLVSVSFARANLFRPPVTPGSVDVAVARRVVQFTLNPAAAVAALGRCLRPGGHLVLGLHHRHAPEGPGPEARPGAPEPSRHTADEAIAWLDAAGIDFVSSTPALAFAGENGPLFAAVPVGNRLVRELVELGWRLRPPPDGDWVVVGRRR